MAGMAAIQMDERGWRPDRAVSASTRPDVALVLRNLDDIARAYGPSAARAASEHVRSSLKFLLHGRQSPELVEHVLRHLSERPVMHDGQRFHLVVSLDPIPGAPMSGSSDALSGRGTQAFPDDAWAKRYREDMALAVTLFEAMRAGRLLLAWQPVRNAERGTDVLYHEALLRVLRPDAADIETMVVGVSDSIEALERLGLVRALDRYVVARAIDELRRDPMRRIGANISAQGLVEDGWWAVILSALEAEPELAHRLVLEITETACSNSPVAAADFVSRLQGLGCSVAIDDFGAGFASIRSILALRPDIVKIDKLFIRLAGDDAARRDFLGHLIGLAGALGANVVVEGIESETQSAIARGLGASWLQGYHLGTPSLALPVSVATCAALHFEDEIPTPSQRTAVAPDLDLQRIGRFMPVQGARYAFDNARLPYRSGAVGGGTG